METSNKNLLINTGPRFHSRPNRYIVDRLNRDLIAAVNQKRVYLVGWLIDLGAEVDALDEFGNSAITCAVQKNCVPIIDILVKAGARLNDIDFFDMTPLMFAIEYGAYDAVMALLKASTINLNTLNSKGESALSMALKYKREDIANILKVKAGIENQTSSAPENISLEQEEPLQVSKEEVVFESPAVKPVVYAFDKEKNNVHYLEVPRSLKEHSRKYHFNFNKTAFKTP
jgi:ankyrin repeat protein